MKNPNILTTRLYKVTKSAISPQLKNYAHKKLIYYQTNFHQDSCKDVRARVVYTRTPDEMCVCAFKLSSNATKMQYFENLENSPHFNRNT